MSTNCFKWIVLLMLVTQITLHCHSKEEANSASAQAQEFARQELLNLKEFFSKEWGDSNKSDDSKKLINFDDFLSTADKGKRLTSKEAEANLKKGDFASTTLSKEISDFIEKSQEFEDLDPADPLLSTASLIVESSEKQTGIVLQPAPHIPDGDNLRTCQESGVYQAFINLNLDVQVHASQVKGAVWVCQGHHESKEFKNSTLADQHRKNCLASLGQNTDIDPNTIRCNVDKVGTFSNKRDVHIFYNHKEGVPCSNCISVEKMQEQMEATDKWVAEDDIFYQNLLRNSDCKLVGEQITGYADTRSINGMAVYRDVWGKKLCFNCGLNSQGECQKWRDEGGVLFAKRCLQENAQGQCDVWEKVFDMGGSKVNSQQIVTSNSDIWGLQNAFDETYEKNKDFGEVFSTMSTLSGVREDISNFDTNLSFATKVFSGKAFVCKRNHFNNAFFDCCGELSGGLIKLNLVDCNSDEKYLQKTRQQGQAVWVGKKKSFSLDGWSESNCYCVFPSKLARIVQEHFRKKVLQQGSDPWGTFKEPDCSGIALEQLVNLNFEDIDLSEILQEVKHKVSQKQLARRLNKAVANLSGEEMLKKAERASQSHQQNYKEGLK